MLSMVEIDVRLDLNRMLRWLTSLAELSSGSDAPSSSALFRRCSGDAHADEPAEALDGTAETEATLGTSESVPPPELDVSSNTIISACLRRFSASSWSCRNSV